MTHESGTDQDVGSIGGDEEYRMIANMDLGLSLEHAGSDGSIQKPLHFHALRELSDEDDFGKMVLRKDDKILEAIAARAYTDMNRMCESMGLIYCRMPKTMTAYLIKNVLVISSSEKRGPSFVPTWTMNKTYPVQKAMVHWSEQCRKFDSRESETLQAEENSYQSHQHDACCGEIMTLCSYIVHNPDSEMAMQALEGSRIVTVKNKSFLRSGTCQVSMLPGDQIVIERPCHFQDNSDFDNHSKKLALKLETEILPVVHAMRKKKKKKNKKEKRGHGKGREKRRQEIWKDFANGLVKDLQGKALEEILTRLGAMQANFRCAQILREFGIEEVRAGSGGTAG